MASTSQEPVTLSTLKQDSLMIPAARMSQFFPAGHPVRHLIRTPQGIVLINLTRIGEINRKVKENYLLVLRAAEIFPQTITYHCNLGNTWGISTCLTCNKSNELIT